MSRSRSFNRFHRYLARQKRRGLRAVLPQFQDARDHQQSPADSSNNVLRRLSLREIEMDLMEAEA
ncbi:hypothetical protein SynA1562_01740 [Synechococcus sp. A15-62]|jgi:hypothetical protein|uniref:hypothetical protein n=1 Tax=Synechococcus sp. A15-62 TaxID=1050657 RepID=UPI0016452344|nr:hypothetical protein [Synechococcus sp. A15-62]QNJ00570.1 hypothetical protein SynA1562_01740 [Synechococcus sp. A15-62]